MEVSKNIFFPTKWIIGDDQILGQSEEKEFVSFEIGQETIPCHFYFKKSRHTPNPVIGYCIHQDFKDEDEVMGFLLTQNKELPGSSLLSKMLLGWGKVDYAVCLHTPNGVWLLRSIFQMMMTWEEMKDWKEIFKVLSEGTR